MPYDTGVHVEGLNRLVRTAAQAGDDLQDLRAAHALAAKIVELAARVLAPKDTGRMSGTLRSSGTARAGYVREGYARVPYAGPIEWGWPARHIRSQHHLIRAAHETEPRWINEYDAALQRAVSRVKGL